jgi:hypothetical protein
MKGLRISDGISDGFLNGIMKYFNCNDETEILQKSIHSFSI